MVMASLAWTLKAWAALLVPEEPRHAQDHRAEKRSWLRMEFATFRAVIELPCRIVRSGQRLIYRMLSWSPWQGAFLRLVERLQGGWLCSGAGLLKSGSGCPDPSGPPNRERGLAMARRVRGGATGGETSEV
jgi:hypothetical protein